MTTRQNLKKNLSKTEIKQQTEKISNSIHEWGLKLPKQRPPVIIISGTTGNGKSSTINCLFGKRVAKVGHSARGTDKAKTYSRVIRNENIHIIDLPGLGDSDRNNKKFSKIYSKHAKKADGAIVVICPPRPAEDGTLKTVRLLLQSGFSSKKIIFGFNKISDLNYDKIKNDIKKTYSVKLNGLLGVTNHYELRMVEKAKRDFLRDLKKEFPRKSFNKSQIVEFDSLSGWNLYKMLNAVVNLLPLDTIKRFRKVAKLAHKDIVEKERKSLKNIERRQKKAREELRKSKRQQELKNQQQKSYWHKLEESRRLKENAIKEAEKKLEKERQEIEVSKLQAKKEIQQLEERIKDIEEKAEKSLSLKPTSKQQPQRNLLPIEDTNKLIQDEAKAIQKIEEIKKEQQIKETKIKEDVKKIRQLGDDLEEIKKEQKRRIHEDSLNESKLKRDNLEKELRLKALEADVKNTEKGLQKLEKEKVAHEDSFGEKVLKGVVAIAKQAGATGVVLLVEKGIKAIGNIQIVKMLIDRLFGN